MFLQQLNEVEKTAFLELALTVANANGVFDDSEQVMIDGYLTEMDLDVDIQILEIRPFQDIIEVFQDKKIQRIVFMETLAVAFADGIYHEEQKSHIHELKDHFSISDIDYESFKTWISKMNSLYIQAVELIDA